MQQLSFTVKQFFSGSSHGFYVSQSQSFVHAILHYQFVMCTLLNDTAVRDHQDLISVLNVFKR